MRNRPPKFYCDTDVCYFCGVCNPLKKEGKGFRSLIETHHIIEKNEGGSDDASNKVKLCSLCHSRVHMNLLIIDTYYSVGYCHKLKWTDQDGIEHFGSYKENGEN